MATEGGLLSAECNQNQDSLDALTREAEQLKAKLEEERAKLKDVDCEHAMSRCSI